MQLHEKEILGSIRDLLVNPLSSIKDEEYQKNVWFNWNDRPVDSYSESCIHFLTSCEYIFKRDANNQFLGHENYLILKKLYNLILEHFTSIDSKMDPDLLEKDELLNDPKWHDIQSLAEEVNIKLTEFVKRKEHGTKD